MLLLIILSSFSCSPLFVSKRDYQLYRKVELTKEPIKKAIYLYKYRERFPDGGPWKERIKKISIEVEEKLIKLKNRESLSLYLVIFPNGKYVNEAKEHLRILKETEIKNKQIIESTERRAKEEWEIWLTKQKEKRIRFASLLENIIEAILQQLFSPILPSIFESNNIMKEIYKDLICTTNTQTNLGLCQLKQKIDYFIPNPYGTRIDKEAYFILKLIYDTGSKKINELTACYTEEGVELPSILGLSNRNFNYYKQLIINGVSNRPYQLYSEEDNDYIKIEDLTFSITLKNNIIEGCSGIEFKWK